MLLGLCLTSAVALGNITAFTLYTYTEVSKGIVCAETIHQAATDSDLQEQRGNHKLARWKNWQPDGHIQIKDHWFRYDPTSPWIIKGADMQIEPGQKIALVGRSGAGKSTLLKVLLKLYNNLDNGDRILFDTIKLSDQKLSDIPTLILRKNIFTIPQDPTVLNGSVSYNLDPLSRYSAKEHVSILESVELSKDVLHKPASELSLGQRQLLHLGRILLAKPKVILMDEATANIDYKTQAILKNILNNDLKQSTLISISHREDWIEGYDKVYLFGSDGSVSLKVKAPQA